MAGALITANWEMEYRDILFGGDSGYLISAIDGLLDLPDLSSGDQQLLRRHGLHAGDDFLQGRSFTVTMELHADTELEFNTKVTALKTATAPGGVELPLVFQIPGIHSGVKSLVMARPRRRNLPVSWDYYHKVPTAVVEFFATDPRIYTLDYSASTVSVSEAGGGLTFSVTPDFEFGDASVGGNVEATNTGDFATPVLLRIDGPVTNPRIENQTYGLTIELDMTIETGAYVVIDSGSRVVLYNGTSSRYNELSDTSKWFDLEPGSNNLVFRAATAETGTLTVQWRSATV